VEIDDYAEVAGLMTEIERRVASNRVWISGSWPLVGGPPDELTYVSEVATAIGQQLGMEDFALVTGAGLTVGSASISGFLAALQRMGSWDLERRLIARPFPQPLGAALPNVEQWAALRAEMARVSGAVVFIGGAKVEGPHLVEADGVKAELEAALKTGAFLLPVGSTGGSARAIAEDLLKTPATAGARRPSKRDLRALMKRDQPAAVAKSVLDILKKHCRQ
jgi:hypothetical protein